MTRNGKGKFAKSVTTAELQDIVVKKVGLGWSFGRIARETPGVYDASHASRLYDNAVQNVYEPAVRSIREQERRRLEVMDDKLDEIINNPPPLTTAAGLKVYKEGTIEYLKKPDGSYELDKRNGKPIVVKGEPVPDSAKIVSAIAERRKVGESYRRMVGADEPPTLRLEATQAQRDQAQAALDALERLVLEQPDLVRQAVVSAEAHAEAEREHARVIPGEIESG